MIFSNNDTVVTEKEFLAYKKTLIECTIERKAKLIIISEDCKEIISVTHYTELMEEDK